MRDFEKFQGCFREYQERFDLKGYKTYFKHKPLRKCFASIVINPSSMVATVRLNSKLPNKDKPHEDIRTSAKHEALHLLINRLESLASYRYATEGEICEASEELVHKLESLIKD